MQCKLNEHVKCPHNDYMDVLFCSRKAQSEPGNTYYCLYLTFREKFSMPVRKNE